MTPQDSLFLASQAGICAGFFISMALILSLK